jgi:cytidylate kinase
MTDKHPFIIAIDGPAASGKSTLGRRLADALGYLFLDTGVMYRAVTWQVLRSGIDVGDEAAVTAVAARIVIDVRPPSVRDGRACDVIVDGHDITWEARTAAVDANVSAVSAYRGVRAAMSEQQRRIDSATRVMVGRHWHGAAEADLAALASATERVSPAFSGNASRRAGRDA